MAEGTNGNDAEFSGIASGDAGNVSENVGGNPSAENGAVDPVAAVGKRGRHKRDCDCAGCVTRRSAQSAEQQRTPERKSAGNSASKSQSAKNLDIARFGKQITGFHQIAAIALKNPDIAISDEQGEHLAVAIRDVMVHYQIPISPQTLAWLKLGGVGAAIYGPKIVRSVKNRADKARAEKAMRETARQHAAGNAMQVNATQATGASVDPNNPPGIYKYQ